MRPSSPQSNPTLLQAVNRECDSLAREVRTLKERQEEGVGAVSEIQGRLSRDVKYLTQQLDKWVLRCEASEARVREHESTIAEGASEGSVEEEEGPSTNTITNTLSAAINTDPRQMSATNLIHTLLICPLLTLLQPSCTTVKETLANLLPHVQRAFVAEKKREATAALAELSHLHEQAPLSRDSRARAAEREARRGEKEQEERELMRSWQTT